jgi:chromosome segregation ATPase
MARLPEVTEEEIISAGQEIEQSGKPANPGSIRTKLGDRGGYPRIRTVWDKYKKGSGSNGEDEHEIVLPTEIEDNLDRLSKKVITHLTQITKSSYDIAQQLAEKRVSSTIDEYKGRITEFEQFEQDASDSIENRESQIDELKEKNAFQEQQINDLKTEKIKIQAELEFSKVHIAKLEKKEKDLDNLQREHAKLQGKYEILSQAE